LNDTTNPMMLSDLQALRSSTYRKPFQMFFFYSSSVIDEIFTDIGHRWVAL